MVYFLLYILGVVGVFFFFKQKTADEVRISDWSSDVCSSDLLPFGGAIGHRVTSRSDSHHGAAPGSVAVTPSNSSCTRNIPADGPTGPGPSSLFRPQIGRASCRERVCQSV